MSRDKHTNKRQYTIRGAGTRRKHKILNCTSGERGKPGFTYLTGWHPTV